MMTLTDKMIREKALKPTIGIKSTIVDIVY
jgi:hypothetical protein